MPATAADVMAEAGQQLENDILSAIKCFKEATGANPSAIAVDIKRVESLRNDRDADFEPVDVRVCVEV